MPILPLIQMCSLSRQVLDIWIRRWLPRCFGSGRSSGRVIRYPKGACHPLCKVIGFVWALRRHKPWGPKPRRGFRRQSRDKLWTGCWLSAVGVRNCYRSVLETKNAPVKPSMGGFSWKLVVTPVGFSIYPVAKYTWQRQKPNHVVFCCISMLEG